MHSRVRSALLLAVALVSVRAAFAAPQELSQQQLRQSVATGRSLGLQRVLDGVARAEPGKTVDVRAFDAGGVYFHVLVMKPNGQLVSVVVDAASGHIASSGSALAKEVRNAAKTKGGGSVGGGMGKGRGTGGGNAGGNGGGNAGGHGGGNGGGNGQK